MVTELERAVQDVAARTRWTLEVAQTTAYIRERVGERPLTDEQVGELCLARACCQRVPEASEELLALVRDVATRLRWPGTEIGERAARIWAHVLDDDGNGRVRLSTFDARGPLSAWLRVVASRLAQRERSPAEPEVREDDGLAAWWVSAAAVEHDVIKDLYVDEVSEAFRRAIASLDEGTRALLQLHYRRGVTLESLTRVYDVHRVTLSRRLAAARQDILDRAIARVRQRTEMTEHECRSLLRTLRSRLDLSLGSIES